MQYTNSSGETKTYWGNPGLCTRLDQNEKSSKESAHSIMEKKFDAYDSDDEDKKTMSNHIKKEQQIAEQNNSAALEELKADIPYTPTVRTGNKNGYAHRDAIINVDDTPERCRGAGVPIVSVPQSVIFELTNVTNNGLNYQQDMVIHTLSNKSRLEQLNAEIAKLDEDIQTDENKINEELNSSKTYYEAYVMSMLNKANESFAVATINLPSNVQVMLSSKTNSLLKETNMMLTSGNVTNTASSNGDPAVCLKFLNESKFLIEEYANDIFRLKMEKIQVLSDLVREQGKAMIEIQNNPSHELTGEEIMRNYYESDMCNEILCD